MFLNHSDVLSTIITCPGQASEEELAEVEAATKPLLDTKGGILPIWLCELDHAVWLKCGIPLLLIFLGKSLEIVLSPAVKKPKSRVSPPTSPSAPTQVLE